MIKRIFIGIISAGILSGCMESQPSMAIQQLNMSCSTGDTNACAKLAQIEAQNRAARIALSQQIIQNNQNTMATNAALFQNTMTTAPRRTYCQPSFAGSVTCTTY